MEIRLQKYLADCKIASRRKCEEYIQSGLVKVNGKLVKELGTKVDPQKDIVLFENKKVTQEKFLYLILHKPKDYISTKDDPEKRKTVFDIIPKEYAHLNPVGRLDRNTTGLLLFTNDGELTQDLMHPKKKVGKVYRVEIDKPIKEKDVMAFSKGVMLEDKMTLPANIEVITRDFLHLDVEIFEGRNRQVRKMFEMLGYDVVKLKRLSIGILSLGKLKLGMSRLLTVPEIERLKKWLKK